MIGKNLEKKVMKKCGCYSRGDRTRQLINILKKISSETHRKTKLTEKQEQERGKGTSVIIG